MKSVIIDDENKVINSLKSLLERNFKELVIVGTASDVKSGYDIIIKNNPDLVFLDIHLPDGSGFDLLQKLDQPGFKVIFISGYEEYAIRAFKFSAIDYLLKPIDESELIAAVKKAFDEKEKEDQQLKLNVLFDNISLGNTLSRIVLRTAECLHFVTVDNIIRCESDSNYTRFFLKDQKRILVSKTIKEYTELLGNSGFIRVHQSHLINMNYIDRFLKTRGGEMIMKDGSRVPVSQERKAYVLKQLNQII